METLDNFLFQHLITLLINKNKNVISIPNDFRNPMNIMNGPQTSTNVQDVRIVVTQSPTPPNVIPVGGRVQTQQSTMMPFLHQQQQLQQQQLQQQHGERNSHSLRWAIPGLFFPCVCLFNTDDCKQSSI